MKEVLKISIIQSDLFWENPAANRLMFSEKINQISEQTDLIILPEMFTTGFTMNALKLAELENGKTLIWMKNQALKMNCAITGSLIISKNKFFYNRLFFVFPSISLHKKEIKAIRLPLVIGCTLWLYEPGKMITVFALGFNLILYSGNSKWPPS